MSPIGAKDDRTRTSLVSCDTVLKKCAKTVQSQKSAIESQKKTIESFEKSEGKHAKEVARLHRKNNVVSAVGVVVNVVLLLIMVL